MSAWVAAGILGVVCITALIHFSTSVSARDWSRWRNLWIVGVFGFFAVGNFSAGHMWAGVVCVGLAALGFLPPYKPEPSGKAQGQPQVVPSPPPPPRPPIRIPGMDRAQALALLGLSEPFSATELRSSYASKVKQYHPDRVSGLAPEIVEIAERETKRLNAAFELLSRR